MAQFWTLAQLLWKLWTGLELAIGWIKREQYESKLREIDEYVKKAGQSATEKERLEAGKSLEDIINGRAR